MENEFTCFFSREGQNVASVTHSHTVDGKNANVVGLPRTQIHQSGLSQTWMCDLSSYSRIPGC